MDNTFANNYNTTLIHYVNFQMVLRKYIKSYCKRAIDSTNCQQTKYYTNKQKSMAPTSKIPLNEYILDMLAYNQNRLVSK